MFQPIEEAVNPKLARIHALLAKAESTEHDAEAESFREKAYELLAKYGFDEAMLAALDKNREPERLISKRIEFDGSYIIDKMSLLNRIVMAFHCHAIKVSKNALVVYGYKSDVERAEFLFASLALQADSAVARAATPYRVKRVTFVKSFLYGFRKEVYERLIAAEKKVVAEEKVAGAELVLINRTDAAKRFMQSENEGKKLSTATRRISHHGIAAGEAAGRRANIGQTGIGGNRARIGG